MSAVAPLLVPRMEIDKEKYKVKYDTTTPAVSKPSVAIEAAVRTLDPTLTDKDKKQELNEVLLQIISNGINDIVRRLQFKLGNNYDQNQKNAQDIVNILNNLDTSINPDIATFIPGPTNISLDGIIGKTGKTIVGADVYKYKDSSGAVHVVGTDASGVRDINIGPGHAFNTLDSPYFNVTPNQETI